MPFSPIPRGVYPSVTHISPSELAAKGVRLVLADLDNTLVPYHVTEPSPEVAAWAAELAEQGIQLFLLSNSRKPGRAQKFAEQLGIPYQGHSGKPKKRGLSPGYGADGLPAGGNGDGGGPDLYRYPWGQQRRGHPPAGGAYSAGGQSGPIPPLRR